MINQGCLVPESKKPHICQWYLLFRVNLVLVGAEGVVENGGIINKLGSYQMAIAAKAHGIPFYVAAESYKVCYLALHLYCTMQVPFCIYTTCCAWATEEDMDVVDLQ